MITEETVYKLKCKDCNWEYETTVVALGEVVESHLKQYCEDDNSPDYPNLNHTVELSKVTLISWK